MIHVGFALLPPLPPPPPPSWRVLLLLTTTTTSHIGPRLGYDCTLIGMQGHATAFTTLRLYHPCENSSVRLFGCILRDVRQRRLRLRPQPRQPREGGPGYDADHHHGNYHHRHLHCGFSFPPQVFQATRPAWPLSPFPFCYIPILLEDFGA